MMVDCPYCGDGPVVFHPTKHVFTCPSCGQHFTFQMLWNSPTAREIARKRCAALDRDLERLVKADIIRERRRAAFREMVSS